MRETEIPRCYITFHVQLGGEQGKTSTNAEFLMVGQINLAVGDLLTEEDNYTFLNL